MATKLVKDVVRETLSVTGHKNRPMIVTLVPGDVLRFRAKGTKKSFEVYLGHCFRLAQIMQYEKDWQDKQKKYKERKARGERGIKKPKRGHLPFSRMYFEAVK